ncbi:unnamed protein product [Penicillium glandicola]
MSGVEVIAVVACVAAIVSAYGDGANMFKAIRKKYHERRANQELERSLARGRTDIQPTFDRHYRELGRIYADGDQIAREHMKDIVITLQGALLKHLSEAQERGTALDLVALERESEQGRIRTLIILEELYQRLARPPVLPSFTTLSIDPNHRGMNMNTNRGAYFPNRPDRYLPQMAEIGYISGGYSVPQGSYLPARFSPDAICASPTEIQPREHEAMNSRYRTRSDGGLLVASMGNSYHPPARWSTALFPSSAPDPRDIPAIGRYNPRVPWAPESIPEFNIRPATPHRPKLRASSMPHDVLTGNAWNESHTDSDSDSGISHPIYEEQNRLSPISPTTHTRHDSISPSITSTDSTPSNSSTQATRPLWPPSKPNNYLGFCKGAWKVHSGFRGFKKYSEPGRGYYTQNSWLRCTKCAFDAPIDPRCSSRNPKIEDSVRTHQASGVRYRFEFLVKSHVPCKRDSGSHFAPGTPRGAFCCTFCCAMAQGSTQVYGNLDIFMAHLAEEHCTIERRTLAALPNMLCVVGRVAPASEYFDVNILPVR